MTQTDNPSSEHNSSSLPSRLAWIALVLATLYICYFHNLAAIGLVGPDEPRYAWIARDMVETGDWVTPRLYGKPWFEKPVLYYWGAALSFKLFGVNEAAARFPSAVSALLATLAIAWLARRFYGAETARWLLLLLPTTVGMIGFSHAAATDMPFSAMLTIAMVCAAVVLGLVRDEHTPILPRTPWLALVLFGFCLGLAALAKGPAAIVLSCGAVLLWAIFTKRWRDALRCLHSVGIASFCLTALPWYIACARRNPDFLRVFIIEHNFKRYLTPEFQHIQPFWFYIPIILIALFPWTIFLIPATRLSLETARTRNSNFASVLFLICWAAFPLAFFTASNSKLPGYILPSVSPLALLLAAALAANFRKADKAARWLTVALGAGLVAFAIALSAFSGRLPRYTGLWPPPEISSMQFTAALAGVAVAIFGLLRRVQMGLYAMILFMLLLVVGTDRLLIKLDRALTARGAPMAASQKWPQFSTKDAATLELKRSLAYQLNFYTHSVLPEWKPDDPKPAWLFVEPKQLQQVGTFGFECPAYLVYPAVIPCQNTASVGGLGAFGRGRSEDSVRNGQSR